MLSAYRILDLTDTHGYLCGKLLADLGAEVIKIEKPGGDQGRGLPPFVQHPESSPDSLYWFAYNVGKKSITLDMTTEQGIDLLRELVKRVDVVIESFSPDYLPSLGLGYELLSAQDPRLILTSITAFGQSGPYVGYKDSDLVVTALSGFLYLTGDPDRVPVAIGFPQAFLHASAEAALGTLTAVYYRELTGQGQQVDVSAQQCMAWPLREAHQFWDLLRVIAKRQGSGIRRPTTGVFQRYVWSCADGFVAYVVVGGKSGAHTNQAMLKWMEEEGAADEFLRAIRWLEYDMETVSQETEEQVESAIEAFFMRHTKQELYAEAVKRNIALLPVSDIRDVADDPHLRYRDYWEDIAHPDLGLNIRYPAAPVRVRGQSQRGRTCPPSAGQHNAEIYGTLLGLSQEEITALGAAGVI